MILTAENSMAADLRLVDSHCHLHDTEFFADNREELYQQNNRGGHQHDLRWH